MDTTKPWWTSSAMWGGIIALIGGVVSTMGYAFGGEDAAWYTDQTVQGASALATLIGSLTAIYGRIRATKRIARGSPAVLLALMLLPALLVGCKTATPSEQLLLRQQAVNAQAFADKAARITSPTPEEWAAFQSWARDNATDWKNIYRWATGDAPPESPTPPALTPNDPGAGALNDDGQDRQFDRRVAGLPSGFGGRLHAAHPAVARAGIIRAGGPDRAGQPGLDPEGRGSAGAALDAGRAGGGEDGADTHDATHGRRPATDAAGSARRDARLDPSRDPAGRELIPAPGIPA